MKSKEIAAIFISAIIEAALTFVLTQVFSLGTIGIVLVFVVNAFALVALYIWFVNKEKKRQGMHDILKEMEIINEEDLITHKKIHKNLDLLGVSDCTDKLTDTPFIPKTCMENIRKTLFFMGVAGSKWVNDPPVFSEFERMLRKVSAAQGEVRFLLLNPKGEGWKTLKALRRDNLSDFSYYKFNELVHKYNCLKVRLYDPLPSFRLQFVDNSYVAVSRYKFEFSDYEKTHYGWDAPHLIVRNEEQELTQGNTKHFWSLYMAFQFLYDHIWDHSKDLSTLGL